MPTNLYGPGDNYDLETSHVLPALIRKAHEAKSAGDDALPVWGSGNPLREFLHVDDLADACVFLMRQYSQEGHVNVGSGQEISIGDLARMVARIVGFDGSVALDASKPDGTPRKLMDSSRLSAMGWTPAVQLEEGISGAYEDFLSSEEVRQVKL
jgi:GDP-L-fucose synthase